MSTGPTFDAHGYPSDETLARIAGWTGDDLDGWLTFCRAAWHYSGAWTERTLLDRRRVIRLVTGGWSGNEDIVDAMKDNMMWQFHWEMSKRGGLEVLVVPPKKETP